MLTTDGKDLLKFLKENNLELKITKIVITSINTPSDSPTNDFETTISVENNHISSEVTFPNLNYVIPSLLVHKVFAYDPRSDSEVHIENITPYSQPCTVKFEYLFVNPLN